MADLAARLVAVFGRSLSTSVLVLFGYLLWFSLRGVPCAPDSSLALCAPALRLGEVFFSSYALVGPLTMAIAILGVGYLAGLLHDAIFDSNLRANYDSLLSACRLRTRIDRELTAKRKEAIAILSAAPAVASQSTANDYLLYEIIGGMITSNTRHYVDEARIVGVAILTGLVILWLDVWVHTEGEPPPLALAIAAAASLFLFIVGREAVKAQYRHRAIRLYVNLVLLDQGRFAS